MQTPEQKAVWRHAQTLSLIAFLALGAVIMGLWGQLDHVKGKTLHDVCEAVLYIAAFFAVFTIQPMAYHFYARLIRR